MKNKYYYFVYYKCNEYYGNQSIILDREINCYEDIKYIENILTNYVKNNINIKSNIIVVNYKLLKIEKDKIEPNSNEFINRIDDLKEQIKLLKECVNEKDVNGFNEMFENILIDYKAINNI